MKNKNEKIIQTYQKIDEEYFLSKDHFHGIYFQFPVTGSGKTYSAKATIEKLLKNQEALKETYSYHNLSYPEGHAPKFIFLSPQKNLRDEINFDFSGYNVTVGYIQSLSDGVMQYLNSLTSHLNNNENIAGGLYDFLTNIIGLNNLNELRKSSQDTTFCSIWLKAKSLEKTKVSEKKQYEKLRIALYELTCTYDRYHLFKRNNNLSNNQNNYELMERESFDMAVIRFKNIINDMFNTILKSNLFKNIESNEILENNDPDMYFGYLQGKGSYSEYGNGKWISEMFPCTLISQCDVIVTTYQKFFKPNFDPFYKNERIDQSPYIKNTILICDEIDALYEIILDECLEEAINIHSDLNQSVIGIAHFIDIINSDKLDESRKRMVKAKGRHKGENGNTEEIPNIQEYLTNNFNELNKKHKIYHSYMLDESLGTGDNSFFYQNTNLKLYNNSGNINNIFEINEQYILGGKHNEKPYCSIQEYYNDLRSFVDDFIRIFMNHVFKQYLFYPDHKFGRWILNTFPPEKRPTINQLIKKGVLPKSTMIDALDKFFVFFRNESESLKKECALVIESWYEFYYRLSKRKIVDTNSEEFEIVRFQKGYFDLITVNTDDPKDSFKGFSLDIVPEKVRKAPEDVLVRLASETKILGLSATGYVGGINNFNLPYIYEHCQIYQTPYEYLVEVYLKQKYENIHQVNMTFNNVFVQDDDLKICENRSSLEREILHFLQNEQNISDRLLIRRYLIFARTYKIFLENNITSLLMFNPFLPNKVKKDVINAQYLNEIFKKIIQYVKPSLLPQMNSEELYFFRLDSKDLNEQKVFDEIQAMHKQGYPVFVITSYQSASKGTSKLILKKQPYEEDSIITMNDFGFNSDFVDFQAICCTEKTQFIPYIDSSTIDIKKKHKDNLLISNRLHRLWAVNKEISFMQFKELQKSYIFTKRVEQSLKNILSYAWYQYEGIAQSTGRLDRTSNKYKNFFFITDLALPIPQELISGIPKTSLNPYMNFILDGLKSNQFLDGRKFKNTEQAMLYNRVNTVALDFKKKTVPFEINPEYRKDPALYIQQYKKINHFINGHYHLDENQFNQFGLDSEYPLQYMNYYLDLTNRNNAYFQIEYERLSDISILFVTTKNEKYLKYDFKTFNLEPYFKINWIRDILVKNGFQIPNKKARYMLLPNIMYKVKGNLFETIGNEIFTQLFHLELKDIIDDDLSTFEQFDQYIVQKGKAFIAIEYKNRSYDAKQYEFEKYFRRLESLGLSKAIIVNSLPLEDKKDAQCHLEIRDDYMILVVPYLLDKKLNFCSNFTKEIQQFIQGELE